MSLTQSNRRGARTTEFLLVAGFSAVCLLFFAIWRAPALAYAAGAVTAAYVLARAHVKAALIARGQFGARRDAGK